MFFLSRSDRDRFNLYQNKERAMKKILWIIMILCVLMPLSAFSADEIDSI